MALKKASTKNWHLNKYFKDDKFLDDRSDFKSNEVSINYNAGFQSTLAALNSYKKKL